MAEELTEKIDRSAYDARVGALTHDPVVGKIADSMPPGFPIEDFFRPSADGDGQEIDGNFAAGMLMMYQTLGGTASIITYGEVAEAVRQVVHDTIRPAATA